MAMVHASKILLFDLTKRRVIGICTSYGSQNYFSILPFLKNESHLNSKDCGNALKSTSFEVEKNESFLNKPHNKRKSKFDSVNLQKFSFEVKNISVQSFMKTFRKMCFIYFSNKNKKNFIRELETFNKTETFKNICQAVDSKLTILSPNDLTALCNLVHFGVPAKSPLMRKILVLLLDNINAFSPLDKLDLYVVVSQKVFENVKESEDIKKACELYFSKVFEDELDHVKANTFLLEYLDVKDIPDSVKQLIIQNCLRVKLKRMTQGDTYSLLKKLCFNHYKLLSKNELLNFVKYCCTLFSANKLKVLVFFSYSVLVQNDNSYYDKNICELLVHNIKELRNETERHTKCIHCLISMGYMDEDLTNILENYLLNEYLFVTQESGVFNVVRCLAKVSYHETGSENIQSIRQALESFSIKVNEIDFFKFCNWCEDLTFLGCDSRKLFTTIFKMSREYFDSIILKRNVLNLHHLAKAYFSDGYEPLDEETLTKCLKAKAESSKKGFFPNANLNEYFESEDYVLRNCTTSDKHFLDFVAVFGPDKKPINLKSYKVSDKELFNIENIEKLPGSQMIIFQKYHDPQPIRFFNVPVMTGTAKIFLKSFESLGCSTVLLPKQFFISSPESKKNYLTSQIDEILEKSMK